MQSNLAQSMLYSLLAWPLNPHTNTTRHRVLDPSPQLTSVLHAQCPLLSLIFTPHHMGERLLITAANVTCRTHCATSNNRETTIAMAEIAIDIFALRIVAFDLAILSSRVITSYCWTRTRRSPSPSSCCGMSDIGPVRSLCPKYRPLTVVSCDRRVLTP